MLHVQEYLQTKSLDDLTAELGIKVAYHPDGLPLVILNYSQIDSPKTNPIVRECRGLCLRSDSFELVARSFSRFYNWGEVQDEMPLFDFNDFVVESKEDGSLSILYYFGGKWRANTRGSFALDLMQFQNFTWQEGIARAMRLPSIESCAGLLDPTVTYICEFCSLWNKVVRQYKTPALYLLTAFRGLTELSWEETDQLTAGILIRPERHDFHSIEEIQRYLQERSVKDATFEGVVIRDRSNHRWKIKSATFLGLHRLKGDGDNLFHPKYLLPFVLSGEEAELLCYFPEARSHFYELKAKVSCAYANLLETWIEHKDIELQKEFALAICKKPFSGMLFELRKKFGVEQNVNHLKDLWRNSEANILKTLKI